ncbi:MAG: hypothetical protein K0R31_1435 [Clostridiales bacterium]|nr:hypothetical protein [Clostridiales bacterium]
MTYIPQGLMINPYNTYPAHAQSMQSDSWRWAGKLKLEGRGSIQAEPDIATVVLGVTSENMQLKAAQEENARKVTNVLNTLKALGIANSDIQTRTYQAEPIYDYIEGKQVFRGYRVLHSLEITIKDIERTGEVIDRAVESGANIINSISFTISDTTSMYQQALNAAIDDAKAKAISVARKLNIAISQVPVQIIEQSLPPEGPIPYTVQAVQAQTPIQPGQIEITAQVEVIYYYR